MIEDQFYFFEDALIQTFQQDESSIELWLQMIELSWQ